MDSAELMKKQSTLTPKENLTLCFRHFPQFYVDLDELMAREIITLENKRLIWHFKKTCLAEYFLSIKGPLALGIERGFWNPIERFFLIKGKGGVEKIERGSLSPLAHENGRGSIKPSVDFEKLMTILKPYREQHLFDAIKFIVKITDEQGSASAEKSVEAIKKLFENSGEKRHNKIQKEKEVK